MEDEGLHSTIFSATAILTCVFGCVGNGCIIWLLSFHIKKKAAFSTYMLNLAVADLGTVAFLATSTILKVARSSHTPSFVVIFHLFRAMYTTSLYFLTTMSMERCVAVFFPHWYQRHRPQCLSARLSFLIWTLSGMFCSMQLSFYLVYGVPLKCINKIMFVVNFRILPSLVAVCTAVLLIEICRRYRKRPPGSLNTVIILMLLFFLIFGGPYIVVNSLPSLEDSFLVSAFSNLLFSVNSSIKSIFYYVVGKRWKCRSAEPLVVELQRVFQEEGNAAEGRELMRVNLTAEEICSVQTA